MFQLEASWIPFYQYGMGISSIYHYKRLLRGNSVCMMWRITLNDVTRTSRHREAMVMTSPWTKWAAPMIRKSHGLWLVSPTGRLCIAFHFQMLTLEHIHVMFSMYQLANGGHCRSLKTTRQNEKRLTVSEVSINYSNCLPTTVIRIASSNSMFATSSGLL